MLAMATSCPKSNLKLRLLRQGSTEGIEPTPTPTEIAISEIPYTPNLDIRNIESLPKGTGAKYLVALKGQGDELIAKQWARVKPTKLQPNEVLVDMKSQKGEQS